MDVEHLDQGCDLCDGTGIGQHGPPDSSSCSECGGRGHRLPKRDDYEPEFEYPRDE